MKTSIFFIFVVVGIQAFSQKSILPLKTTLKNVTVFLNGAQIERMGTISIPEGNSMVVVTGLPIDVNPQTVQVSGKGNFSILSVSHSTNYLVEQQKPKEIMVLEDSLQRMRELINDKNAVLSVYNQEEAMIIANKQLGGQNNGVSVAALKEASDFFRVRLLDIKTKQLQTQRQINDIQKKITKIESQLNERNAKMNQPTSEVLISVWASAQTQAQFQVSYVTSSASWYPLYDLKVKNINSPIQLTYKANVEQRTGEDWNNIKMTLSTANPFSQGSKPEFAPWYLSFYQPYRYEYDERAVKSKAPAAAMNEESKSLEQLADMPATTGAHYTTQQTNMTTAEFIIDKPYDIPSGGQGVTVEMTITEMNANYEYYAYPKANPYAYLLAKVTGFESLNMLPGDMHLFFENTYVGKSNYNGVVVTDTVDFSLGQDKGISIKREKMKDFSSKKIIGTNQRQSIGFQITVRNNKNIPVSINLLEQLPLSTNKDIEIEKIELSNGLVNDITGAVLWKLQLKPGESKQIKFVYAVKYPKDKTIILE
ncbi:MAG: DUF4139 domain-containing protein [Bacteroidales bacterium]|nr:DUF4139 domain-containing protein [Bacteroidales bacterium]